MKEVIEYYDGIIDLFSVRRYNGCLHRRLKHPWPKLHHIRSKRKLIVTL